MIRSDGVNLLSVLHHFNFHLVFIDWISACIQQLKISVLVNGAPSSWFFSSMGLRQGSPSLLYYVLVSEMLTRMLHESVQDG